MVWIARGANFFPQSDTILARMLSIRCDVQLLSASSKGSSFYVEPLTPNRRLFTGIASQENMPSLLSDNRGKIIAFEGCGVRRLSGHVKLLILSRVGWATEVRKRAKSRWSWWSGGAGSDGEEMRRA